MLDSCMSRWKILLAGTGWSSIFGLSFLMTKSALETFSPFELLFLRFALATLALGLLVLLRLVKLDFRGKPRLPLFLICLFQPVLYFACETFGLREVASSTGGLILGALPAAVAALSLPMLHERLSLRQGLGLCASVGGVVLIVLDGRAGSGASHDSLRGLLLVVGALASAAFYNIYSRRASRTYKASEITFAMMASGAAFFGLLALGQYLARGGTSAAAVATPAAWAAVAYLGLLSSVLAFFLVNLSLSKLKASQASAFGTLVTLVSLVAGLIFRGERMDALKLLGAAAIIGGVWAVNAAARVPSARA